MLNCQAVEWALAQDAAPSSSAKFLLVAIASRTEEGVLRASQAELAAIVKLSDRQVRTLLRELVDAGLITRTRNGGTGAGRVADTIALGQPEASTAEQPETISVSPKQPEATAVSGGQPEAISAATGNIRRSNRKKFPHQPEEISALEPERTTPKIPPYDNKNSTPQEPYSETLALVALDAPSVPKKRRRGGQFDPAWTLGADGRTFAAKMDFLNGSADALFERFKDHHIAKGSIMADWSAAWRTWVRNEVKYDQQRRPAARAAGNRGRDGESFAEFVNRQCADDQPLDLGRLDSHACK